MLSKSENRALVIKEQFGITVSDIFALQLELCQRWGRPLDTLNTKKFVKRDGQYVLVPRCAPIDIWAILNGETKYPIRDATQLPSKRFFRDKDSDKGYHDEWRLEISNPSMTVEVGEVASMY